MLISKQKLFIPVAILLGIAVGGVFSLSQKPYQEASRSFIVQNQRNAAKSVYDYEGYYTLQTANEAAKTLISWLTSPGGVTAVYADAGVKNEVVNLRSFERVFSIRRAETPFFEIRYKAKTKEDSGKLSGSLEKLLQQQLAGFQNSDSLSLAPSPLVALDRPVPLFRNSAYGGLLAGALAVFAALFKKAMETAL